MYVNGLLVREQTLEPPSKMVKSYNFALGPMSVTKNMGTIRLANVRVWKRVLPLGEVQHSMAARDFASLPRGLIMNMHCDDCGTKGEGNEIDLPVPRWHLLKVCSWLC